MSYQRSAAPLAALAALSLTVLVVLGITSCSESGFEVVVELRTDLVPDIEFDRVRTELVTGVGLGSDSSGRLSEVAATPTGDYFTGFRVAEFSGVAPGSYLIRVQVIAGAGIAAERFVAVDLIANTAAQVVVTRSCRGVTCPEEGDAAGAISCVGGLCVLPECTTGREEACPPRECARPGDCPASTTACSEATCVDGLCIATLDDAVCSAEERCHPELGCVDTTVCVPLSEICNGADDDCDDSADEDFDLSSDIDHCGACGNACGTANGAARCDGGTCRVNCNPGFADCNGISGDGCEADISTATDCGGCGAACAAPTPLCESTGDDTFACAADCAAGTTLCGSSCVDTSESASHCGSCGNRCDNVAGASNGATPVCAASSCTFACNVDRADCNGNPSDACEVRVSEDANNCGACGIRCGVAHGTAGCGDHACVIASCDTGWADCDGIYGNGCETSTRTLSDCGSCGTSCTLSNATSTCAGGTCRVASCNAGWGDCGLVSGDGCSTQLNTVTNCGACGATCSLNHAMSTCGGGTCSIGTCETGWLDCNDMAFDGCETGRFMPCPVEM